MNDNELNNNQPNELNNNQPNELNESNDTQIPTPEVQETNNVEAVVVTETTPLTDTNEQDNTTLDVNVPEVTINEGEVTTMPEVKEGDMTENQNTPVSDLPQAPEINEPVSAPTIDLAQDTTTNINIENTTVDTQQQMMDNGTNPIGMPTTPTPDTTMNTGIPTEPTPNVAAEQPLPETTQTEKPKQKNNPVLVVILLLIIIGAIGYAVYTYFIKEDEPVNKEPEVTEVCEILQGYSGNASINGLTTVIYGEKQYNFNANNVELFSSAYNYPEKVDVKVCAKNTDITNYSLINKIDNTEITATTEDELRTAIGLKKFGKYTEKATLVEIGKTTSTGIENEKQYTAYDVTFKLENGENQKLVYKLFAGQTDILKSLKVNQTYTLEYEILKGSFDIEYVIKSVK